VEPGPVPENLSRALITARGRPGGTAAGVYYYTVAGSTNDLAARLAAEGAPEGTIVMADAQTAGRGRSGRTWFSPPGAGLYVSIVLRPAAVCEPGSPAPPWVRLVTLAAGVAIAAGLRAATGLPLELKWPNDIVVADRSAPTAAARRWRKLAGILVEAQTAAGELQHLVLGYGINVAPAAYPREIDARATSLAAEAGRPIDRGVVLGHTLEQLGSEYDGLRRGEAPAMLDRWRGLAPSAHGARVRVDDGTSDGVTAGIDEDGALLVVSGDATRRIASGEVTWL
jgi:BirA family biotin operon repressor/biotin-[acetyl-CoA-carboxylase] ligase